MKGYYIDIIDQVLNESLFVIEVASKSGVTLFWNGGDAKDELKIVGSSLEFDIAHREKVDAKFIKFFTGNEIRFKVELRKYADDGLVWRGHLIPDTYSEPYTNGVTFVKIKGTCGLGRLKGKYLPESYYRDEKSIIDILCKILSLTGLEMDLFFNPAIENSLEKSYKNIFIDTGSFIDNNKKKDSYNILETLMNDMLCVCFQADGRWNIEGINQRSVRSYKAKLYDFQGNEKGVLEGLKLIKKITSLANPNVTMVPPYNMITVMHPRVPQSFPNTIAKEKNEGWVVVSGVKGEIYATDWNGNNAYYAKAIAPDYYVSLMKYYTPEFVPPTTTPFNAADFINLKNKIFVYKYQKLTIKAVFKLLKYLTGLTPTDVMANNNPFLYEILLNDAILFSNNKTTIPENENLIFKDDEAKLDFEVIIPEAGLIDIKIYRSGQDVYTSNVKGFEIRELAIAPVSFGEKLEFTDLINDEYTIDKDVELTYADDDTAFSNCFRLAKLKEATEVFNTIEIPIIYNFSQSGNYYSVVNLDGANLIKDNIDTTVYGGAVLENLEVIYNYNSSEQMVVKTDFAIASGSFLVKVYKNDDYVNSRVAWLQWTDSIYKIETNRYAKTVANVVRRMYNVPSEKLDAVAVDAVKFNDLVLFHYVNDKQFVPTNCSWNLDENKTTLTLSRAIYRDSGDTGDNPENIPPIVNAGVDIELSNSQTTASLLATAYDTDGYIASQKWTKIIGGFGDVIMTPLQLATDLQNLTEDLYEYQIQVTDNDGATAVDSVRLVRKKSYVVSLQETVIVPPGTVLLHYKYKFNIAPNIDPSFNLVLKGKAGLFSYRDGNVWFRIRKNNVLIFEYSLLNLANYEEVSFSVGYISTDEIVFEIEQWGEFPEIHYGSSHFKITEINFVNGAGDISGLPLVGQPVHGFYIP
ncbi:PKD domain-containing protein [Flavobacterium aestivum]|uniref:PKD domain-containing protein n=1 Tax=Flavobacterium aestivum TaxID=3003257 RepID=UPI0024828FF3|nr:hypothetical protein [Flavobacterium aestivum]